MFYLIICFKKGWVMDYQEYGKEICIVKPSIFRAIVWTLIAILPIFVLFRMFSDTRQMTPLLIALGFVLMIVFQYLRLLCNEFQVFERGVVYKTIFGTKSVPLNGDTEITQSKAVVRSLGIDATHDMTLTFKNGKQQLSITEKNKKLEPVLQYLTKLYSGKDV